MKAMYFKYFGIVALTYSLAAAVYQESAGRVVIEAEHYDSSTRHTHSDGQDHHWHISPDHDGTDFLADAADPFSSARGNSYIQVLPNGPGGGGPNIDPKAIYKVYIQTPGRYQLFLRWRGASGSDDSLYAGIATLADGTGGTIADWYRYSQASGTDFAASWQGVAGFERTDASGNDVPATWQINDPGIYTIVISQREDGAAVDTLLLQLSTLATPAEPGPAESAISTSFPPSITSVSPTGNNVAPGTPISVLISDGGNTQVATGSVQLSLNGTSLTPTVQRNGNVTTVSATPSAILPAGSNNDVVIIFSDTASPANTYTNEFQFTVANYATLGSSLAYPANSAVTTASGFKARVVQANTASGTLANSIARAESQLAGTLLDPATGQPFVNEANLTAADANGFFTDSDIINWNQNAGVTDIGNFQGPTFPDEAIPGIPGTDGFNTDNIAAEVLTFLELPAGPHTFGVNSDDGFALGVAGDARDVLRTILGSFDAGRGAGDSTFSFVVETAGIYSFRLLWFEGGGDASLEFFSVDPATGQKIPINDRNNPKAIKAWREITAPTQPYVSAVSPTPGAVGVPVDANIELTFTNGGLTVDTASIQIKLGDQVIPTTVSTEGGKVKVVANPPSNLAGNTEYVAQVTYKDSANTTTTRQFRFTTIRPPISLPPLRQDDAGLVVIEAENFDANIPQGVHAWVFDKTPAGYTGDGTMYALPDAPGAVINAPDTITLAPRMDYKVNFVKTGTHYLWFRGSDGGGNSVNAGFNNADGSAPNDTLNNIDAGCCGTRLVPGGTTYAWVGSGPNGRATFEVTQTGVHTINLWMREDGQIVDKLLITTDPNYTPTGAGPAESARVGDPFPPTISITSPTPDQQFAAGSTVTIAVDASDRDGTVSKVEFFASGIKIGEDTTSPFTFDFKPDQQRSFTLTAKATDNSGLEATSGGVKIVYGNPPAILFVANNPLADAGDAAVVARLESQGFLVTAVDDNDSDTAQADGKVLVIISSTVGSGNVNVKFTDVAVPIINWEEALFDELKMTGDNAADPDHHGSTGGLTQIQILDPAHPLAAGLTGTITVTSTAQTMSWGVSDANPTNAIVIAQVAGDPSKWAIWAYDEGGTLFDASAAPERRVGFFFNAASVTANTPEAWQLFDAAVNWALRRTVLPPPEIQITRNGDQVTISWTGGGTLEFTDVLQPNTTWTPITGSSPVTITPSEPTRFYRVKR